MKSLSAKWTSLEVLFALSELCFFVYLDSKKHTKCALYPFRWEADFDGVGAGVRTPSKHGLVRTSDAIAASHAAVAPELVPLDDGITAVGPGQTDNGEDAHQHSGDDGLDRDRFTRLTEQHCTDGADEGGEPDGCGTGVGEVGDRGEHLCLQQADVKNEIVTRSNYTIIS